MEIKYSKKGWPLSATSHSVETIYCSKETADSIAAKLNQHYGSKRLVFSVKETSNPAVWDIVTSVARMSLEKYLVARAFVAGYKSAIY